MSGGHAAIAPSGWQMWGSCAASVALGRQYPEAPAGPDAEEGTAHHRVAELVLSGQRQISELIGQRFNACEQFPHGFELTVGNAEALLNGYINPVLALAEGAVVFQPEVRLPIDHVTGESGATGTSDTIIIRALPAGGYELIVGDLKWGQRKVFAERNWQLCLYAAGALREYSIAYDITSVRMAIFQPRLGHVDEWVVGTAEFEAELAKAEERARRALAVYLGPPHLVTQQCMPNAFGPSEDACRYCRALADCTAAERVVFEALFGEGEVKTDAVTASAIAELEAGVSGASTARLAAHLSLVKYIESWCKAVSRAAYSRALRGERIPGHKLIRGRKGDRAWRDAQAAEQMLKSFRVKSNEMYTRDVISPAAAEKRFAKEHPRWWAKLEALVTQSEGGYSLVPESDTRPAVEAPGVTAVATAAAAFSDITPQPAEPVVPAGYEELL